MGKASKRKSERRASPNPNEPTDQLAWEQKVATQARDFTLSAWRQLRSPENLLKIHGQLLREIDRNIGNIQTHLLQLRQAGIPDAKTDCKKGCDYCCHLEVTASAPEVIYVARYIKQKLSPDEQAALMTRLVTRNRATQSMPDEDRARARHACPLLVGGECSVHPARPVACRTFHSSDVAACRRGHEGGDAEVPVYRDFSRASGPLLSGELTAFAEDGRQAGPLWFTDALEIALTTDAAEEWCRGSDPFKSTSKADYERSHAVGLTS